MRYAIAPNGIFWSIQGEGHLRGFQMAFVRLAGCSVGCPNCDTDYRVDRRLTAVQVADEVAAVMPTSRDQWVWITGGEPTDQDLRPLLRELKRRGWSTALATSGVRRFIPPVDWLSVSPHGELAQRYGSEVKVVVGLNAVDPDDWIVKYPDDQTDFMYRYVQPVWEDGAESASALARCLDFLRRHPNWSLSRQDHKSWGVA